MLRFPESGAALLAGPHEVFRNNTIAMGRMRGPRRAEKTVLEATTCVVVPRVLGAHRRSMRPALGALSMSGRAGRE